MDLGDLNARGWTVVDGVSSQDELVALGKSLGSCVRTPNGELVKVIRRIPRDQAPTGGQSALYGSGPFPLHTDTVFWPLPVRYVLLRGHDDTRRPTTFAAFSEWAPHDNPSEFATASVESRPQTQLCDDLRLQSAVAWGG